MAGRALRVRPWRPPPALLTVAIAVGAVAWCCRWSWSSAWLVPLVWTGFVLLLEPINYRRGRPSWLAALARGDASLLVALLAAGAVCGGLWEFWNYWALSRWTYTVPYLGDVKLFEMPVLGYLGLPALRARVLRDVPLAARRPRARRPRRGAIIRPHALFPRS